MSCKRLDKKKKVADQNIQQKPRDIQEKEIFDTSIYQNDRINSSGPKQTRYHKHSLGKTMLQHRFANLENVDQMKKHIGDKTASKEISDSIKQEYQEDITASMEKVLFSKYSNEKEIQIAIYKLKKEIMDYYQRNNEDNMVPIGSNHTIPTNNIMINKNDSLDRNSFNQKHKRSKKTDFLLLSLTLLKRFFLSPRFLSVHFFNTFEIRDIFNLLSMLRVVNVANRNLICKIFQILMIKGTYWEGNGDICEFRYSNERYKPFKQRSHSHQLHEENSYQSKI